MDAIILAGGKGSRMDSPLPKQLVPVKGKPILAYQIDYLLKSKKINKIMLALGYRADEIVDFIESHYQHEFIDFCIEKEPLGTGGALKKAMKELNSKYVLVFNCDDLTDISIDELQNIEENTICAVHPTLPFGRIKERRGYVVSFEEKPVLPDWVSCGWYVFDRDKLLEMLPDKGSLEYDVLPKLKLKLFKHEGFWQPLNTKKDVSEFENNELPASHKH